MENEAAPTGGRLASPEVIGGKSNRHSGEKGAPQAPFFHAFFRVAAGEGTCGEPPRRFLRRGGGVGCCGSGDVASGRALRGRFGRKGRGGRPFFMPFFGWWLRAEGVLWGVLGEGALRGRGLLRRKRRRDGVRAGGGWSRGVRAPFFVVWGMEPSLLGAAVFLGEGIVWGKPCGENVRGRVESRAGSRRARMGAAAGSGELGRKGAAAGERGGKARRGRWRVGGGEREGGRGNEKRAGRGGKKEEAFGKIAERFVWGLICFAARALE